MRTVDDIKPGMVAVVGGNNRVPILRPVKNGEPVNGIRIHNERRNKFWGMYEGEEIMLCFDPVYSTDDFQKLFPENPDTQQ